jgi:glycolate oxidase iron-sulfur subunit
MGQTLRPLLPHALKNKIPVSSEAVLRASVPKAHPRKMLLLEGCAQPALAPNINAAATRVLDRLGITLYSVVEAGCCGAVSFHLNDHARGLDAMRRNIDAWLPHLDAGAEAIVMTASGCGVTVKDYAWHLRDDPAYAAPAARISAATRDLSEILADAGEALSALAPASPVRVAFHPPCTLQHGQQISGVVETLLTRAGFALTPVAESHLCCGSAGTYSILQPAIAQALQTRKLGHLQAGAPDVIVTANIGCLTHLQSGTTTPVKHWIELLDQAEKYPTER